MYKTYIDNINRIIDEWKTLFSVGSSANIPHLMYSNEKVYVSGHTLDHLSLPCIQMVDSVFLDPEKIRILFYGDYFLEFGFWWLEDPCPDLRAVCYGYTDSPVFLDALMEE